MKFLVASRALGMEWGAKFRTKFVSFIMLSKLSPIHSFMYNQYKLN